MPSARARRRRRRRSPCRWRQRVLVEAEVVRPARLYRRGARVVLCGEDQDVVVGFLDGLVGERLAGRSTAFEPDLDAVTRIGPRDESAHDRVVHAGLAAVAVTARPLLRRHADRGVAVDGVHERHVAEAPSSDDAHLLRVAVGVLEREVRQGQPVLVGVVALQVEGLGLEPEVRHRLGRIRRGLGHVEREGQGALELRLHLLLVVGEHEPAAGRQAFAELRRPGQSASLRVREIGGLTIGHVQHVG